MADRTGDERPAAATGKRRREPHRKRILVPLDVVPMGETKLPVAAEYARALHADVLLLHVLPPSGLDPDVVLPTEAAARAYLDSVCANLAAEGVHAQTLIHAGPVPQTIVDEATAQGVALIIMGANTRPSRRVRVRRSVADEVARLAPCPVLQVRPSAEGTEVPALRSFQDDVARAGPVRRRSLGMRLVEVPRIIGSVGRVRELGPDFRPLRPGLRRRLDEDRFKAIRAALERGETLPPVELYKLGFGYYVLDGHHRVAAAYALDQPYIEAEVTAFTPIADHRASRTFTERRAFEEATGLMEIGAARPESYATLRRLVETFQRQRPLADLHIAARLWHAEVFRPLWRKVRRLGLVRRVPGDRSADAVARLAERWEAETGDLETIDWDAALERYGDALAGSQPAPERPPPVAPISAAG